MFSGWYLFKHWILSYLFKVNFNKNPINIYILIRMIFCF